MVEAFSSEVLIYGFGLFFIFAVLIIMIVRYSNRELLKKIAEVKKSVSEDMVRMDKEMRLLVIASARERKEMLDQMDKANAHGAHRGKESEEESESEKKAKKVKISA